MIICQNIAEEVISELEEAKKLQNIGDGPELQGLSKAIGPWISFGCCSRQISPAGKIPAYP